MRRGADCETGGSEKGLTEVVRIGLVPLGDNAMRTFGSVIVLLMMVAAPGWAEQSTAPRDPPFEQYRHVTSEAGDYEMVLIYHSNGTFESTLAATSGRNAGVTQRGGRSKVNGRWWWEGNTFCFMQNNGGKAGLRQCKTNGNYIGRDPIVSR